jgi:hypothetical protein
MGVSGQNVSNNFVKIFNDLYLLSMDFALCLTLDIPASLVIKKINYIIFKSFRKKT